ncbi:MAG: ABC transporter ATP-binding protein [Clostridia bacterium]|nr:ABC transporter ATP-binding protein [Clostridia bacterium]
MEDAIRLVGITKTFGQIRANRDISLTIRRGEILSLLGENGSGKTTLMNILSGIYFPDSGQVFVGGREVTIASPKDAFDLGIGMIHQHFKLVDVFTAAENIILGLPGERRGRLDMKAVEEKVRRICDRYGFDIEPDQKVYEMTVSQKQTLEIVKVLYRGADILILDEPTAVLTPQETEKLFAVMREMKKDGHAVVIITHKLHEVLSVSDRVSILRKGEYIGTVDTKDATELSLTEMMVGKKVTLDIERPEPENLVKRIEAKNLNVIGPEGVPVLKDVSFEAYGGEILGIAGISGCGQKELLEAVAGLTPPAAGSSILFFPPEKEEAPEQLVGRTPREIKEMGVHLSFVPEDRLGMGLVASMGMTDNMMLKSYEKGSSFFVEKKQPREVAEMVRDELAVVTPSVGYPVRRLSGGNVQKVLVGREIAAAPAVLMTAYAVRGLDIGTSYQIYRLLNEQKKKGVAVIYVGEDLDVLIDLCDRILVLCAGQVTGIVDGRQATKESIGLLMTKIAREDDGHRHLGHKGPEAREEDTEGGAAHE